MAELLAESVAAGLPEAPILAGLGLAVAEPSALVLLGGDELAAEASKLLNLTKIAAKPKPGNIRGSEPMLVWQGHGRWLLYCRRKGEQLRAQLLEGLGADAAMSEVGDAFFVVAIKGAKLRDLLAMGTSTDCSPAALPAGSSAVLRFAELPATLIVTGDEEALLLTERASKAYVWTWLCRSAAALA